VTNRAGLSENHVHKKRRQSVEKKNRGEAAVPHTDREEIRLNRKRFVETTSKILSTILENSSPKEGEEQKGEKYA